MPSGIRSPCSGASSPVPPETPGQPACGWCGCRQYHCGFPSLQSDYCAAPCEFEPLGLYSWALRSVPASEHPLDSHPACPAPGERVFGNVGSPSLSRRKEKAQPQGAPAECCLLGLAAFPLQQSGSRWPRDGGQQGLLVWPEQQHRMTDGAASAHGL